MSRKPEEIKAQILQLEEEYKIAIAKGKKEGIAKVKEIMDTYQLSFEDIQNIRSSKISLKEKKPRGPLPIKYRISESETWSGVGKMPRFLNAKLDAGEDIEKYKVKHDEVPAKKD
jgi:DNA-binding protein H-NS